MVPDFDTEMSREICDAATPENWWTPGRPGMLEDFPLYVCQVGSHLVLSDVDPGPGSAAADARFIAYARSALPVALDVIDALRDEKAHLTEALRVAEDETEMLRGLVSDLSAGRPVRA